MMFTSMVYQRSDDTVMVLSGILNASTYQQIRDSIVKVAVDEARAIIVDVNDLQARDGESWAVFTSARWCVQQWPQVPIAMVTSDPVVRRRLAALSITRYVPVYESLATACEALAVGTCRYRHRARENFCSDSSSVNAAALFVRQHLLAWSMQDKIPVAATVITVFAENALAYTRAGFDVRLEGTDNEVIVAVSDSSQALAVRRERPPGSLPAGLDMVSALCRHWGNAPTTSGKTVWARIGPNDSFAGIGALLR